MIKRNNANSLLWVGIASLVWECQLKPKIRMQTLESLAYTLNHIFLEDRKVKAYEIPESDEGLMAAESRLPYEKIENAKHV